MMLDTNGELFPAGRYEFRVADIPAEADVKGYKAWQWTFEGDTDEGAATYNERFMVWTLAPLLRALGFKELAPGKFDFEPTAAVGRSVQATIKHVTLDKGASAGKTVARMTEIQSVGMQPEKRAAMAAQAPNGKDEDIPF